MDIPQLDPFATYDPHPYFCELTSTAVADGPSAQVRARIAAIGLDALRTRAHAAEGDLFNLGITFTVYSEATAIDRILPFDCIPRIIAAREWAVLERGVMQRVKALNLFLADIYNARHIVRDGIVPGPLVFQNSNYRPEMEGFPVRFGTYVHICGIDLVRDQQGAFCVLEDNARTPSGVSYVVENRHLMLRTFPDMVAGINLRPVDDYGRRLRQAMNEIAPEGVMDPQVVLLSPGIYNSAYFEHVFLAREMGVPLVEGLDLTVEDDRVWMRTTGGLRAVHTIYRRIRRRLPGPERVPPGQPAGRARPDSGVAARQRDLGQRGRHRRRGRQGDLRLHAPHHSLLPERGRDPAQRRDQYLWREGRPRLHARPSRRARDQACGRERRLRHHCGSARQQGRVGGGAGRP